MSKSITSSCSDEDISGNRKISEQGELSKADFLGWIAAKCKALRKDSKTFFEFEALENFSELVLAILVKANEKTVKCDETLYRSIIDEMWAKLEEQKLNDRRAIQDVTLIWPFVKEFVEEIGAWRERQQQSKKDFFIRRAFQETKNASPPVLITIASPDLVDDEPKSLTALRKRRSAEAQQSPNSSVLFVGSVGGCTPKMPNWTLKREEKRCENEQSKKRRTEDETEQRKNKTEKAVKQEVIEVDEQKEEETANKEAAGKELTNATHSQPNVGMASKAVTLDTDKGTEKATRGEEIEKGGIEEEDDSDVYTLPFGDKTMFEIVEDSPQNEPKADETQPLREVKREQEESGRKEDDKRTEDEPGRGEEEEEMVSEEEDEEGEEGEEQSDEEEGEGTGSERTRASPPPTPADKALARPYSPLKSPATAANCGPNNRSLSNVGVAQCKREQWTELCVEPQLKTPATADSAQCSASADGLHRISKESPQKRSEFDIFDPPILSLTKPSPAKNERPKYSGKIKIRKLKEYEAEQKLKRKLAIEGNVISRQTANEKSPFFIASSTTKFLKKPPKTKNEGPVRRRKLNSQDFQVHTNVRDVVTAVDERSKELSKQLNSSTDELSTARGDRLVRISRLLLTDSLLQRLDEETLKNAYVLRSLEHPLDIGIFIQSGLIDNTMFLANQSRLVHFEFSYLFVFYGHDQIVHCQRSPDPSEFLSLLCNWFSETLPNEYDQGKITLMKNYEENYHYFYTPPRIVAVTIPEVGEHAEDFRTFNDQLRLFVSAENNCSRKTSRDDRFLLLDWARMVAECSDGNALESEEKRMQLLAVEMKCEFGVLIK
ncbi:hypothetical protein niasHT_035146 [Heterodera trifolii]|uniref:Uncharacterized protein n=1 Tax=Heterodera trifolii TaxID=157864 RepID=A0ABD2J2H0_9BILA